jgi:excinuclease ABC subunit C
VSSYFADPGTLSPKTAQLVAAADRVEWIQVNNEVEALLLEYSLIQAHRPRFNIRLVDDKSYPWLALSVGDEWPRAAIFRGSRKPGVRYFGPYAHVGAIRETLDLLLRSFPVRTCSDAKLQRHQRLGKPCLLFHIERCAGPCVEAVSRASYDTMVTELGAFLGGRTEPVVRALEAEMTEASQRLEFERAARLRDRLATLHQAVERQQVVTSQPEDLDVIGLVEDPLEAAVCVFHVRGGRVVGRRAFVLDRVEDVSTGELVGRILEQVYGDASAPAEHGRHNADTDRVVPPRVLVPALPEEPASYEAFLAVHRGGPVALRVPQRGAKRALMHTVVRNAEEELSRHRLRRASDHESRTRALQALQDALGLPQAPLRIECYDMSHLQGSDYVGSMVVLEDGLPRPSEYRRFRVRDVPGNDDYAAMHEVLTRRFTALLDARAARERGEEGDSRLRRFSYPPQLVLLDGGKGQLAVGVRVLEALGLQDSMPLAALAKSFEEVFVPGRSDALQIPRGSDALFLLQRVRDEAHRFAISYHRALRSTRMTRSVLDDVPGLGPARRARLLKQYGSLKSLRSVSRADLMALPWLPDPVAEALYQKLHAPEGPRGPAWLESLTRRASPTASRVAPGSTHEQHERTGEEV